MVYVSALFAGVAAGYLACIALRLLKLYRLQTVSLVSPAAGAITGVYLTQDPLMVILGSVAGYLGAAAFVGLGQWLDRKTRQTGRT